MDKVYSLKRAKTRNSSQAQNLRNGFKSTIDSQRNEARIAVNYYQRKSREIKDLFDASPTKSPTKKQRRSTARLSSINPIPDVPIGWETENASMDCHLNIKFEMEHNQSTRSQDKSSSFRKNDKIDQMLNEFHHKLQFERKSKKEDDRDSGNEDGKEFDELLDDSWIKGTAIKELDELEKKISQPTIDESKESGMSSCDSMNVNKKKNVSYDSRKNSTVVCQDFKIPETPAKSIRNQKSFLSTQFNSTPKIVSRQSANKLNQSLFEDISPIKGNEMTDCLVNVRQEAKRPLDDSQNEENSCKKRNGRKLFETARLNENKQTREQPTVQQIVKQDDDEIMDDSFDLILSQVDEKVLVATSKPMFVAKSTSQRTNHSQLKPNQPSIGINKIGQYSQIGQRRSVGSRTSVYSNTPPPSSNTRLTNFRSSLGSTCSSIGSQRSSIGSTTRSASSIKYEDDSSSLFVKERPNSNNLNYGNFKSKANQIKSQPVPTNRPIYNQKNFRHQTQSQPDEMDLLNDDDADFICSQVAC